MVRKKQRKHKRTLLVAALAALLVLALGVAAGRDMAPGPRPAALGPFAPSFTLRPPPISARSASLYRNGQLAFSLLGNVPEPTASTTKMMTAYVTLTQPKAGLLAKKYRITAKDVADMQAAVRQNDQELQVQTGEVYTGRDLFAAMMLPSDNNAASMLASAYPGGEAAFVDLMNRTATQLGLKGAHFADPSGLSAKDLMSAKDVALLAMDGLKLKTFSQMVGTKKDVLSTGHTVRNLNQLLGRYRGATGVKTGWTVPAGHCLAFSAIRKVGTAKVTLVGAVMGEPSWTVLYRDVVRLLNAGFSQVPTLALKAGTPVATVSWGAHLHTTLRLSRAVTLKGPGPYRVTHIQIAPGGRSGSFLLTAPGTTVSLPIEGPPLPFWYPWLRALSQTARLASR